MNSLFEPRSLLQPPQGMRSGSLGAERTSFSVTQLLDFSAAVLDDYIGTVSFHGEIHEVKVAGSGHLYITIKDDGEGAQSAVSCVMWKSAAARLSFRPQVGAAVTCVGKPTLYRARGQFQIDVRSMSVAGDGALRKQYEDLRIKLESEGLFDPSRKRSIPRISQCVGVVTSAAGAVLHDISATVQRRMPALKIVCVDVRVQGKGAAEEIVRGIHLLNSLDEVEVIIVARGGGSLEDLWAFNEEAVVRAIFGSRKPIISGVGHEVDITPDNKELRAGLDRLVQRLKGAERWLRDRERFLDNSEGDFVRGVDNMVQRRSSAVLTLGLMLQSMQPDRRIQHSQDNLHRLGSELSRAMALYASARHRRLDVSLGVLNAVNPQRVLERGYALVTIGGRIIDSVFKIPEDRPVKVRLRDGEQQMQVCG
jgi:exodeoxyribonuclease VII large subunit